MSAEKKNSLLLVDDTETNIDILVGLLGEEYDVLVALDGPSALEIVNEEPIDLILLDIMMPEMSGFEVCTRLKRAEKTRDIPIIFLTAKSDEESIEQAYDVGGIDYVTKPFKPKELKARVKTQLRLQGLIHELEYTAAHDALTGVYNRRKFFELGQARFQTESNLCAVMFDIDHFKSINDTYGHTVGDQVIRLAAETINAHLDERMIFGRLGGEEFSVLAGSLPPEELHERVEQIRKTIGALRLPACDAVFTISAGIAAKDARMSSLDQLLNVADASLYSAKEAGRNCSVLRLSRTGSSE